jgi:hypothetical protein
MTGIKISVERLQVGNYVSLPLGWREHPFLFSSFKLKSEEEIELIRRARPQAGDHHSRQERHAAQALGRPSPGR